MPLLFTSDDINNIEADAVFMVGDIREDKLKSLMTDSFEDTIKNGYESVAFYIPTAGLFEASVNEEKQTTEKTTKGGKK